LKSQFSRADNAAAETRAARKKTGKKCTKKQELDSEHTPGNQVDIFIWGAQDLLLLLLFLLYPRKGRTICDADDGVTGQRKRTAAAAAGSRVWGEGSGDERSITAAEYAPPSPRGYEVEGGVEALGGQDPDTDTHLEFRTLSNTGLWKHTPRKQAQHCQISQVFHLKNMLYYYICLKVK